MRPIPVRGRRALITGAGSGIGRMLAVEAARRGMAVALVGRRQAPLEETRALMPADAGCLVLPGDVTVGAARGALRDAIAAKWGTLDVLVNNAGIVTAGALREASDPELERLVGTNLAAPIALTRDCLPLLRAGRAARVVNIGSLIGDIPLPFFAAYAASKAGLRAFSDALRRELRPAGIGVTHIVSRGARTAAAQAVARFLDVMRAPLDEPAAIARLTWDAVARGADNAYPGLAEWALVKIEQLCPSVVTRALAPRFAMLGVEAGATRPSSHNPVGTDLLQSGSE